MLGQAMSWHITASSDWPIIFERKHLVAAVVIQHRRQCRLRLPSIQNAFVIFVGLAVLNLQDDSVVEDAHLDIRRLQQATSV